MKTHNYYFNEITNCNMCGDDVKGHKVLGQRLNQSQGKNPKRKKGISSSVMLCTNCDLIYSNPQPVPHDIQDHYGIPPESYWTPDYFKIDPNYFSNQIEKAKKFLPFTPGMKALDIGAGLGKAMISFEAAGFDAYGVEPSTPFYERALKQMNIKPEKLQNKMLEKIEYEPGSFDFITFGAVLEHLYDPSAAIARALTWLKPTGIIHIEVPSSKYLISKFFNAYYRLRGTNFVTNISPMHPPFHMYEFGLKSFLENQKINHYKVIYNEFYACPIVGIPKLFHPVLNWYMERSKTGMQLEVWLKKA